MGKSSSQAGQNRQSATPEQDAPDQDSSRKGERNKRGKDAASHVKAGSDKGAGGGKKQGRKH
jgi:hypothetical protein